MSHSEAPLKNNSKIPLVKQGTHKSSSIFVSENFPSSDEDNDRSVEMLDEVIDDSGEDDFDEADILVVRPINEIFICFGHEEYFDGAQNPETDFALPQYSSNETTGNKVSKQMLVAPEDFDIFHLFEQLDKAKEKEERDRRITANSDDEEEVGVGN